MGAILYFCIELGYKKGRRGALFSSLVENYFASEAAGAAAGAAASAAAASAVVSSSST